MQEHTTRRGKSLVKWIIIIAAVLFLVITTISSAKTIPEGHIGVKYQFGRIIDSNLRVGLNFRVPFVQTIEVVDIREHIYEAVTPAYTKDTQTIESLQVKMNYSFSKDRIHDIISTVGVANVESKLIVPQVNSILKNAVGSYKAEELVQNRTSLQERVESELRESLASYGILVSAFNVENIDFEDSFEEVIRAKVAAEQEALRMKNETISREEQARQQVIAAQGQADSQRIEAEAEAYAIELLQKQLKASPEYIQLQLINKWDGAWPQVMGETVNPFVTISGPTTE